MSLNNSYVNASNVDGGQNQGYNETNVSSYENGVFLDENNNGGNVNEETSTDPQERGQGGYTGERFGTLQENLGRNNDQGRATRVEQGGSPGIRSSEGERNITPEQEERYTAAILRYKSSESYQINAKLREDETLTEEEQELVNTLDEALEQLPTYEGTVYRQIIFDDFGEEAFNDFLEMHVLDKPIFYEQYISCSTTEDGYEVEGNLKVKFIVEGKSARDVDGYGNNMEREVIFPRNTVFIVKDIDTSGQFPIIYLQEDVENGYNTNEEQGDAVWDLQASHSGNSDMQGVSEENTTRNTFRQVRPQPAASGGQWNTVRAGAGQETLLSAEGEKQEVSSDTDTQTDGESGGVSKLSAAGKEKSVFDKAIDDVIGYEDLTDDQRELKRIGSQFGAKVAFKNLDEWRTDPETGERFLFSPEGQFDPDTNTITLNSNAKEWHRPVEYILKHELTHSFEVDPEAYNLFAKDILNSFEFEKYVKTKKSSVTGKNFENAEQWKKDIISRYKKQGIDYGAEAELKATQEMIANFVGDCLFGGRNQITEKLLNAMKPQQQKTFIQKIKDFIAKVKEVFKGKPELTEIERLEKAFLDTAKRVSKRNQNPAENTVDSQSKKSYSLFSGSKTSENLYDTQDNLKPASEKEWSAFNRQFANKTNGLKNGQKSNIMIYTSDYAYFVSASGYMRGKVVAKIEIDGNEERINTISKEFKDGTFEVGKGTDLLAQSIRSDRGRGYRRHASLKETLAAERNGELDGEAHGRDHGRNNRRSRKTSNDVSYSLPDPVTYDDNGNVIPLSKRFNQENNDMRYSLPEVSADHVSLLDQYESGEISREEYLEAISRKRAETPVDIAGLKKEDADTTPDIGSPKMRGEGDGESRLYDALLESDIITDEVKAQIADDTFIKNYGKTTNKRTLGLAAKKLSEGGANEVERWRKLKPEFASPVDVAEGLILLQHYQNAGNVNGAVSIAEKLHEIGTVSGQTVQLFSIIGRFSPEMMVAYAKQELEKAYEIMVQGRTERWIENNKSRFELTDEEIKTIRNNTLLAANLEDGSRTKAILLGEITALIQDKLPPEKGQGLRAWMRISLLLNPKAFDRNLLGNASMVPVYISSDLFGGLVDKAVSASFKTGERTTGFNAKIFGESLIKGMKKGTFETLDDFKRHIRTKQDELNRFETNRGSGKSFDEQHTGRIAKQLNTVAKFLNTMDRVTSLTLELGDRPFYEMWFMNSLNNQLRLNNTDIPTQAMLEMAKEEALQRTWQDSNAVSRSMTRIKNALNGFSIRGYGLGDVLLKFIKTPANIGKAMVEMSPVGFVFATSRLIRMQNALKTGQFTPQMQKEAVRSISNALTGTMFYLLVAALAGMGAIEISGGGDDDKDVSNFEKYIVGIPPYSIEIFGQNVTYTWNQPLGTTIAIVADIIENNNEGKDLPWYEQAIGAFKTAGTVFTEQSFLSNIYDFFAADDFVSGMVELMMSEPAAMVPTVFSQLASFTDPKRRTTYESGHPVKTALNDLLYRLPLLRQTLPAQVNVLGEESKNMQYLNPWTAFAAPGNTYPKSSGAVAEEIYELYKATGDKTVMPRTAPNKFTIKGNTIAFTAKERAEFQRSMGITSMEILEELFGSSEYKALDDGQKTKAVKLVYDYAVAKAKSELDYDYEILSAMEGYKSNGEPILSKATYNKLNDKAKRMLAEEYFFSKAEYNCKGNTGKLVKLFMKQVKE